MKKNFYNIDEISQIVGEQKHTIRFWENRIEKLNVIRTHSVIDFIIMRIYYLLKR